MADKPLYAIQSHSWGSEFSYLIRVDHCKCSDCGKLIFRSASLGQGDFFFLSDEELETCKVVDNRWSNPYEFFSARLARQKFESVQAISAFWGRDEKGTEHLYCSACASKVIEAECVHCHAHFNRARDLTAGQACEPCFVAHVR